MLVYPVIMKKLILISVPIVAALVLGTNYYFGIKAEESLTEQKDLLSKSSFITIESHQYERGWFSSTQTAVIRLKPTLLHNVRPYLPDNLSKVFNEPITVVNHVQHGPLAGGFHFAQAHVETEFKYQPEVAKILARFFGEHAPATLSNTIAFGGAGEYQLNIPAFDYEELSGIKLNWKGLSSNVNYKRHFDAFSAAYRIPALHVILADKGDFALEQLDIDTNTTAGTNGLALGDSSVKVKKFAVQWKEGIDYNVKLNELVNLVTDLQIGAFINPNGTVAPSQITLDQLQFNTKTTENGAFINSEGHFQFKNLAYGKELYGPLNINVLAEHLDAKGLIAIKTKMSEIADKQMSNEEIQNTLLHTVRTDASPLFTQNPVIQVKAFDFKMPDGQIKVNGKLSFNGLQTPDLNDFNVMVRKTHADFNVHVPQKILEQLAINQARTIFSVNPEDEAAGLANINDINETLRLMVDSTINSMAREGYLKRNNGNVDMRINLKNNELYLNDKLFKNEPEPELNDEDLLSEDELAAEVANTSSASAPLSNANKP